MRFPARPPEVSYVRKAELLHLHDADSLRLMIDDGREHYNREWIRLYGVDTPETRGAERSAGQYVLEAATRWLNFPKQKDLIINSVVYEPETTFNRVLCFVWSSGRLLNKWLLDEELGWPTDDKGKLTVARDIGKLSLPRDVIRSVQLKQKP